MNNNPDRTSHNFFRLGSAFLEGEIAEPSLKKLREVRTQIYSFLTITADLEFCWTQAEPTLKWLLAKSRVGHEIFLSKQIEQELN